MDLVALLVLVTLAISGLLSPEEALSGFSNPAVVTVWAVFILGAGLARTGVANSVGRQILRLGGQGEVRLVAVIMLTAGGLSAFMNNVGVAAMLLPVINHVARKKGLSASKLLMPLAFGSLLGGMTTLIGTPTNILVSDSMQEFGLSSFELFDFIWVGLPVMLVGIAYMALFGHRLLPSRDLNTEFQRNDLENHFDLSERFFTLRIPQESALVGRSLAESRLGAALNLTVIGILRGEQTTLAPEPNSKLQGGDQLMVLGRSSWLDELARGQQITLEARTGGGEKSSLLELETLISQQISMVEASIPSDSPLLGKTLAQADFRNAFKANVLAIWRGEQVIRTGLHEIILEEGDRILVQATRKQLNALHSSRELIIGDYDSLQAYNIEKRLLLIGIPESSSLSGKSLVENKLADAFGLSVLGILRSGEMHLMPSPNEELLAGDKLIVEGKLQDVEVLLAFQDLEVQPAKAPSLNDLESDDVDSVEVVLSPHSNLNGKSLLDLNFREKFGLSVLAIWRGGRAHRSNLRHLPLRHGDSLLIFGNRNRIRLLASEADFLVLSPEIQAAPRHEKAALASSIVAGVVLSVGVGWLPIAVAAVAGAALMVLTDCINMEEAYRSIQWQAIFLIAGMLPLGLALQSSGAARFLASQVITAVEPLGPIGLMAGIFLLANLASQVMPNPVVAVLMIPIAINTAVDLSYSPFSLAMLVALGASASFLTPVGHPANILVMGPGGYQFKDYVKVGLPLTLLMLVVTLLVLPIFWPLHP